MIKTEKGYLTYENLINWSYGVTAGVIAGGIFLVRLVLSLDNDKTSLQFKHLEIIIDTKIEHINQEIEKMNAKITTVTREVEDILKHSRKNDSVSLMAILDKLEGIENKIK